MPAAGLGTVPGKVLKLGYCPAFPGAQVDGALLPSAGEGKPDDFQPPTAPTKVTQAPAKRSVKAPVKQAPAAPKTAPKVKSGK